MPRSFLSNVRFGADQAIIAESVTTGGGRSIASPTLLAARPDRVGVGRGKKKK